MGRAKQLVLSAADEAAVAEGMLKLRVVPLRALARLTQIILENFEVPDTLIDRVTEHMQMFLRREREASEAYRGG